MDDALRAQFRSLCSGIDNGTVDPYEAASELWQLGLRNASGPDGNADSDVWAHWLIWGALTDRIERRPAEKGEAEAVIIDAARGWLSVENDPAASPAYLDHLLYDVCGYARPTTLPPTSGEPEWIQERPPSPKASWWRQELRREYGAPPYRRPKPDSRSVEPDEDPKAK